MGSRALKTFTINFIGSFDMQHEILHSSLCPLYFVQLYVESTVSMEVSYFNLGHNVWEPLLEPSVDPSYENQEFYLPWTLKASVSAW